MRNVVSITMFALCLTMTGCLSQMSVDSTGKDFRKIQWRDDFQQAKEDARKLNKPILMVGGAGSLEGFC